MKILVVKPTALGDVAQALTVTPLLKQPAGAHLTWLVDEDYAPLVRCCSRVDEIITFPRRRLRREGSATAWWRWLRSLRQYEFDLALDLQGLARSALMMRSVRARRRIGLQSAREFSRLAYDELVADAQPHAADRYLAAARLAVGADAVAQPDGPPLLLRPSGELPAGLRTGAYTVLHPYSLWTTKLWPWRNYTELARLLPEEQFALVGHGAFFPVDTPNVTDFRNQTDLSKLLLLLSHARAAVSTDSGPLHVAAAFDRPLLALFGATDPRKTAPRGPLALTEILTAELSCRPCLRRECQRPAVTECLGAIAPERVAAAWRRLITKM